MPENCPKCNKEMIITTTAKVCNACGYSETIGKSNKFLNDRLYK